MRASIIDCTLREGTRAKQCSFSVEQSAMLARKLAAFGVDMIECGHPGVSAYEVQRVRAVVEASPVPVLAYARATIEDVDAVVEAGAAWTGISSALSDASLQKQDKDSVVAELKASIAYAKSKGLRVRATIEDAGRTSISDVIRLVQVASASDAERVCFSDTAGMLFPEETHEILCSLKREFRNVMFEYQGHNDQGLALANALAALRAGAEWVATSCNGIGARAGITDTLQLAGILSTKHEHTRLQLKDARALSKLVEIQSRVSRSPMQPFVGDNAIVDVAAAKDPPIFEQDPFIVPFEKSSTELRYHRHGPGKRFVLIDRRLFPSSPYYFIARKVDEIPANEIGHVDRHAHNCDSVFIFLGEGDGYAGLTVEVTVGSVVKIQHSPATVFIPAGVPHSYRFLHGEGTFVNFVNQGDYNSSLLDAKDHEAV